MNNKKTNLFLKKWAKYLNRPLTTDIQMKNKQLKGYSYCWVKGILLIRELQIEATMRHYYTPVRMANIHLIWRNRKSHLLLIRMQNGTAIWKDSLAVFYKVKVTAQFSNHTAKYLLKWDEKLNPHKTLHTKDYITFIHIQNLEATKMLLSRWIDKQIVVQIYNGIFIIHQ